MDTQTVPVKETKNGKTTSGETTDVARRDEFTPWFAGSNPLTYMRRFTEDMERVFEDWSSSNFSISPFFKSRAFLPEFKEQGKLSFMPQIERFMKDGNVIVRADLPGVKKEDVKVEVEDGALVIQGERKQEKEEKGEGYFRSERSYGSFFRSIPLPEGTELNDAKATFNDGVLEVTIKAPEMKKDKVQIEIK